NRVFLVAGGHRDVIAPAGRHAPHAGDDGKALVVAELLQVVKQIIRAADGAAGGIDADHDRLDVLVFADLIDLVLDKTFALQDQAVDRDDRHLVIRRFLAGDILLFDAVARVEIVGQLDHHPQDDQAADDEAEPADPAPEARPGGLRIDNDLLRLIGGVDEA